MKKKIYPTLYTLKEEEGEYWVLYIEPTDPYKFMTYSDVKRFKNGTDGVASMKFVERFGENAQHLTPNMFERRAREIVTEQAETRAALAAWGKKV